MEGVTSSSILIELKANIGAKMDWLAVTDFSGKDSLFKNDPFPAFVLMGNTGLQTTSYQIVLRLLGQTARSSPF